MVTDLHSIVTFCGIDGFLNASDVSHLRKSHHCILGNPTVAFNKGTFVTHGYRLIMSNVARQGGSMRGPLVALFTVSVCGVLVAGCSGTRGTDSAVQPVKSQLRPAVPVIVDVSQLSNGDHTIYAKDGNRLNASIQDKAITGLRIIDNSNRPVPIHTIKRLSRDGRTYMGEDPERLTSQPTGMLSMAPPFVPGDCGLIAGGPDSWWVCATDGQTPTTPPPPMDAAQLQ